MPAVSTAMRAARASRTPCGITTTHAAFCVLLLYPLLLFVMHPTGTGRQPHDSHVESVHARPDLMARREGHPRHNRPDGGELQGGNGHRADRKTSELVGDSHVDSHERHHRHGDDEGHERRYRSKHDEEGGELHGKHNDAAESRGLQPGQLVKKCRIVEGQKNHRGFGVVSKRCVPGQHEQQLPPVDKLLVGQADSGTCGCDNDGVAKCLPSAIIIGIEKGSTAELKGWLGVHPEVSIFTEELRYWDTVREMPTTMEAYMHKGFCVEDEELDVGTIITMEKSPSYAMYYCKTAERLRTALPSVKMITLLRDPVERTYSSFYHHCRHGGRLKMDESGKFVLDGTKRGIAVQSRECTPALFNQYIADVFRFYQENGKSMESFMHEVDAAGEHGCVQADEFFGEPYGIVSHGVYGVAFEHYFRTFPRGQFLHILTDDFKKDPSSMVKTVERFLGLSEHTYNTAQGQTGLQTLKNAVGHHSKDKNPYPPPGAEAKQALATLAAFFRADVERLKAALTPELRERIATWNWAHGRGFDQEHSRQ